ncbi:MAG: glycosyltransferase [Infirmifilum sp.]
MYTVVMAAHNEEKYIGEALKSVFSQTMKPAKVIVVLDRCTDKTAEIAQQFPVEIIEKKEKSWVFSYSENLELARRRVETPFYAIVDADVILEPNYFEQLISEMDDNTACIGGVVETRSNTILGKLLKIWEKTYKASIDRRPRGCALLIRTSFLEEIGGFADVPAPDTYVQDAALKSKYKVKITQKTKAYHVREITLGRAVKTQFYTGISRYIMGKSFLRTLGHSIIRLRPFVAIGYIYAILTHEKQKAKATQITPKGDDLHLTKHLGK